MTDEELANAIVAAGVGFKQEFTQGPRYSMALNREYLDAPAFVRDWRVAGAMIEKCHAVTILNDHGIFFAQAFATEGTPGKIADSVNSKARAINEACVKALEDRE